MEEISNEELCYLIKMVKKVGQAIKNGLPAEGYNIQVNNDPVAGQIIHHLHFHIIPRIQGDGLHLWPQAKYKEGEAEEVMRKIKEVI
jgi:histidine triad (HIT) family protein